jgi:dUTP pyrophosphatase
MKVKFKKLNENAVIPSYAKSGDAGMDLIATSHDYEESDSGARRLQVYGTGLAVEIPEGYVGLLFPRSSIAKKALYLTNAVGVIDSGYRGEIKIKFAIDASRPTGHTAYSTGDRIAQLVIMPFPTIEPEEATELSNTERGEGGFGSTGV